MSCGDLVVVGRDVRIADRPVEARPCSLLILKSFGKQPRKIGEIVQRRAADAPAGLVGVAKRVLAFEQERRAGGLDPPAPEIRADQIGELPVGSRFEQHDLLAGLCQHRGEQRAGSTSADDDDVDFFVSPCHHLFVGAMWAM